jgi:hypothetical protein
MSEVIKYRVDGVVCDTLDIAENRVLFLHPELLDDDQCDAFDRYIEEITVTE